MGRGPIRDDRGVPRRRRERGAAALRLELRRARHHAARGGLLADVGRRHHVAIEGARVRDEPAAVVSKATTAEQQTVVSTLANSATDAASAAVSPPAMLIVGDVGRLREGLDWLSALGGSKLNPDPLGNRQLDHSA